MNVLVYSDEGTSLESVKHATECLRFHLSPHYAVSTISRQQLLEDPWPPYTALLVIPGGADLPYCRDLNGLGNRRIRDYVKRGGKFLGICAGGYYASARIEFEAGTALEVSGPRELGFYKGNARGAVYSGFCYGSDVGARAAALTTAPGAPKHDVLVYVNGGCLFEGDPEAEVVATYSNAIDIEAAQPAAVVRTTFGKGTVLLSGAHFEYELDPKTLHSRDIDPAVVTSLYEGRGARREFVQYLLGEKLGLHIGEQGAPPLTPLFLTSRASQDVPSVTQFVENMAPITVDGKLADSHDTFVMVPAGSAAKSDAPGVPDDANYASSEAKRLFFYPEGLPSPRETPFFNHQIYFAELERMIAQRHTPALSHLGGLLMYGEVVTSTSTMLERNPQILRRAPNGLVVFGTQQVAGRGRGNNVWVNPIGVMAVSGVIRIPQSQCQQSLVFIQYLCSLALANAVNSFLTKDIGLRIKWPNDLYLVLNEHGTERTLAKVSGVIVSCHVFQGDFVVVFGSGTNVDNPTPTVSINSRIAELDAGPQIKIEMLLARFLTLLGEMIQQFLVSGFAPFEKNYLSNWMHSNAQVLLERYGNVRATVTGISSDSGMLVAHDEQGQRYELQPDGNSFDMMRGLIKRKV